MQEQELFRISNHVAFRKDWVQGAGGNTSVKTEDGTMLIKASGKLLKEVAGDRAYVTINTKDILVALKNDAFDIGNNKDIENLDNVLRNSMVFNESQLRPSMETSFHCLYGKYVLHTHNVYANIFLCSSHFHLLETCFDGNENYSVSLLGDYYTPGTVLSWHIYDSYRFQPAMPNITFLPNHGVIYSHESIDALLEMYDHVEQKLTQLLQVTAADYPGFNLQETAGIVIADCTFLFEVWKTIQWKTICTDLLFPDQAIYIQENELSDADTNAGIYIDFLQNQIVFSCSLKTAEGIMEIMIAYFYMMQQIINRGYEPLTINSEFVTLRAMQSEQYRKQQMK